MGKRELDLTVKKYADQSVNKLAIMGMCIMNGVLALAYLIEEKSLPLIRQILTRQNTKKSSLWQS